MSARTALRKMMDRLARRLGYVRKAAVESVIHPPSELFWDVITNAGSLVIDCDFCGRTHFAAGGRNYFEDGELEKLEREAKRQPDLYLGYYDCDAISWGFLNGRQAVYGCPCNSLRRYEDFVWNDRSKILRYLRERTAAELQRAQQSAAETEVPG